jgi:cytochrome P450
MTEHASDAQPCPVVDVDYRVDRPFFWTYSSLDSVREHAPISWNSTGKGYWMVNRYEEVKEGLRLAEVFRNDKVNAFDPDMELRLLPQTLNGDEHIKFRNLLNPWFSPGAVKRLDPLSRARSATLIEAMVPRGSCDFVADFGILYPTEIFLSAIGLPVEDGQTFVGWVEAIFGGFFAVDSTAADQAAAAVTEYFQAVVADRDKSPRDPETDFVSFLLGASIDGVPLPREDVVTICLTIMLAGLDTTRSALGYIFHHLATHDADRHRLLAQPEVVPRAIEEFLRLYALLIQDGRYVAEDIEFHGCPMKKGDMVSLGIVSANRDPRKFERADEFVMDRAPNPHIAFGLGPHRCLGMHLARRELTIAVEEWHARIPNYRLAEGAQLTERGGQLSLTSLPLEWDAGD